MIKYCNCTKTHYKQDKTFLCFLIPFFQGFTLHQQCKGLTTAAFQLYWWRKISSAPMCIISGMSGHLNRSTEVQRKLSGQLPHMNESEVPGRIQTHSGEGQAMSFFPDNHKNKVIINKVSYQSCPFCSVYTRKWNNWGMSARCNKITQCHTFITHILLGHQREHVTNGSNSYLDDILNNQKGDIIQENNGK